jgi:hypothetical protein
MSEGMFVLEVQPIQSTKGSSRGDSVIKARPAEIRRDGKSARNRWKRWVSEMGCAAYLAK